MTDTDEDLATYSANLKTVQGQFGYYSCLLMGNIGLISNLLNIVVCMRRKKIRRVSMGFYNPLMSLFNILNMIFAYLYFLPVGMGLESLFFRSDYHCILLSYLGRICVQMSSWLNIMLSLDRTISITYPNRFTWHKNRSLLIKIVLGILLVISVINVPNLMFEVVEVQTTTSENVTVITKSCTCKEPIIGVIRDSIAQLMRTVIPLVLEFGLSSVLIYKLIRTRSNLSVQRSLYRDYKFSLTILMLNLMFFITHFPLFISLVYLNAMNYYHPSRTTTKSFVLASFLNILATVFATWMYATVFFVNLAFNKHFKNEFLVVLEDVRVNLSAKWASCSALAAYLNRSASSLTNRTRSDSSLPVLVTFRRNLEYQA